MKEKKVGIFKANSMKDGGFYIDHYLNDILVEYGCSTQMIQLSRDCSGRYKSIRMNYKNPVVSIWILVGIIRAEKIDVLYTNQFVMLLYLVFIRRLILRNCKVVAKVDGRTIKKGIKRHLYFLYDKFWVWAQKESDFVVYETLSAEMPGVRSEVINTPATNFYGCDMGTDSCAEEFPEDWHRHKGSKTVLFVGRYSFEKGYFFIPELAERFPNFVFLTAGGDAPIFDKLPNVIEYGALDVPKLRSLYGKVDCLLVPSVDDSYPSVIREFSYFGKPILATNVGSMHEFVSAGVNIRLTEPNIESLSVELPLVLEAVNRSNKIFFEMFDPNNVSVQNRYIKVFNEVGCQIPLALE